MISGVLGAKTVVPLRLCSELLPEGEAAVLLRWLNTQEGTGISEMCSPEHPQCFNSLEYMQSLLRLVQYYHVSTIGHQLTLCMCRKRSGLPTCGERGAQLDLQSQTPQHRARQMLSAESPAFAIQDCSPVGPFSYFLARGRLAPSHCVSWRRFCLVPDVDDRIAGAQELQKSLITDAHGAGAQATYL
jgi:hypothetical protein